MLFLNKRRFFSTTILLLFVGLISACNQDDEGGIRVHMTDAPAFYDELNVEITKVMVNKNFDDNKVLEWQVIYEGSIQVNILDYQHGEMFEIGEAKMEEGEYSQIRVFFGTENSAVIDGEEYELEKSWTSDNGFKLPINAKVTNGSMTDVYIDMSAYGSVVRLGESAYGFRPDLRVINPEQEGSVTGTVSPADSESLIHIFNNTGVAISSQINSQGFFKIIGISDGIYDIAVIPQNQAYSDTVFTGVEITGGSDFEFEETIELSDE